MTMDGPRQSLDGRRPCQPRGCCREALSGPHPGRPLGTGPSTGHSGITTLLSRCASGDGPWPWEAWWPSQCIVSVTLQALTSSWLGFIHRPRAPWPLLSCSLIQSQMSPSLQASLALQEMSLSVWVQVAPPSAPGQTARSRLPWSWLSEFP